MEMLDRMQPAKKNLQRIGFSVRQFLATFLLATIILLSVQSITFHNQVEKIRDNQKIELRNSLEQTNLIVNYYVYSIQELLRTSVMRDDLFHNNKEVEKLLREIPQGRTGIKEVYTKQQDGRIICGDQYLYQILHNKAVEEHMIRSEKQPGIILWSEPYYSRMQADQTMCVAYTDRKTGKVIAAEVDLKMLYQDLKKIHSKNSQSFVLTTKSKSTIFFDTSDQSRIPIVKGMYPLQMEPDFIQAQDFNNDGQTLFRLSGNPEYYGMHSNKNVAGWYMFAIVDDELLNRGIDDLKINFLIYLFLGLAMVGFAVYRVVFYFTKPIRQLAVTMEGVRDLETLKPIENDRVDEVGRLTDCYNRLMLRVQDLVEDVKVAEQKRVAFEFRMYQNQIGPHFLRNTLYCIASLLRQERIKDAEVAIKSLAGLLAYSFDNSNPIVNLNQEINSLEKYLDIQKVRYGDIFSTNIEVREDAANCKILKFILQPLVENAIMHGLPAVAEGQGRIEIRICRHKKLLVIFVGDNGCGMSKEQIDEALNKKHNENQKNQYSGIGIANIAERIRLQYGETYGVKIYSSKGKGTVIRVKLPYVADSENA